MIDSYFEVGKVYHALCENRVYRVECIDNESRIKFKFIDNFTIGDTHIKEFDFPRYCDDDQEYCYGKLGNRVLIINTNKKCFKRHYIFKRNFETTTVYDGRDYKIKVHVNKKNIKATISFIDILNGKPKIHKAICYIEHRLDINNPDILIDCFHFNDERYEGNLKFDLFYPGSMYRCTDGDILYVLNRFVDDMLTVKTSKLVANVYIDKNATAESISSFDIKCDANSYIGDFKNV